MPPRYPGAAFLEAAQFTDTAGSNRMVTRIVIHDMEMAEGATTAEACARMFHTSTRQASAHFCVDSDTVVQCVDLDRRAWHAPPNTGSIGIEHAGFAAQSRSQWLDPYGTAMLTRSAALTAWLSALLDIPVVKLTAADLLAGRRGLCGHVDVSKAWHKTDHTDPGAAFPWDWYLDQVSRILKLIDGGDPVVIRPRPAQTWSNPVMTGGGQPLLVGGNRVFRHVDYWMPIGPDAHHDLAVLALQNALNSFNTPTGLPSLQLTARYDEVTTTKVRAFQRWRGLTKDGIAGPITAVALGLTTP